ncbi:MAG TPA: GAF and ANTAR domain-containing protein [Acidimicrobiia bacterium]|nr:GAF and ANTAR domain-containing protein [Acidimicrobiia bacterium]
MPQRDALLAQTFVDIADTLVADFDVLDYLSVLTGRCVDLFDLSEAGIMLADTPGALHVAASSSERMGLLELFELQHDEGPCLECYRTGGQVACDDLAGASARWPVFAPEAMRAGFGSVFAVPLRLRDQIIGSLNLLRHQANDLAPSDLLIAQALADVATIGILQHRAADESRLLTEQLQYALNSRVVIEQAKGVVSEHTGRDMPDAFAALRSYAREHNARLVDVAEAVAARTLPAHAVVAGKPRHPPRR